MTATELQTFELTGPLPTGTAVIEASAGTGKTYTIAGLVVRWVAETPLRLPDLLVVTFTRAATAELRHRVRQRLVAAVDHLREASVGQPPATDDPVLIQLADTDPAERVRRHDKLTTALTELDAATIATIHGFCQHVLAGLGIAGDLDREAQLVEDVNELIEEVVDDVLVEAFLAASGQPRIQRDELLALGQLAVANPTTALIPTDTDDPAAGLRVRLAERVRSEVARRSRRRRLLSYNDLLTQLEATLRHPDRSRAARLALRDRYQVALIDEFQDTDPIQWGIVATGLADEPARPDDGRALVLIGDPKQAIYAFRGADVYAYLDAAATSRAKQTLGTNWRSDLPLLKAFNTLFAGATFGDAEIPYRQVEHAPGHRDPRLVGAPEPAAMRLRLVPRHPSLKPYRNKPNADRTRDLIAGDLAADIVRLLEARPELVRRNADGEQTECRPLVPRDVAVLVRTHDQAAKVQTSLRAVGVPAVVAGAGNVFAAPAATDWRRLLDALERPASSTRVRALALSAWIGWTADRLTSATEQEWDRLHEDVHTWAGLLRDRGVATMHRTVTLQRNVAPRLLSTEGGERELADLDHIGELLHAAATAEHLGPVGLSGWLQQRMAEAGSDTLDERLRRLETDDEAVQILTIHRSKGLEFPVVYCPYLWSSNTSVRDAPVFHDDDRQRLIDVGGTSHADFQGNKSRAEVEACGEELRLLYVTLTRAQHQVVAWYAPAGIPEWSGLGRLLLCRTADGSADVDREAPLPDDDAVRRTVQTLADRADGTIAVETVPEHPDTTVWQRPAASEVDLERARFTRVVDTSWRRTSYTALTRLDDPVPRVGSEPEEPVKDDEPESATDTTPVGFPDGGDASERGGPPLPLADLPGGTAIGTFVHRVLETADFAAPDLDQELTGRVSAALERRRHHLDADVVVAGLHAALTTPLGRDVGGLTLRQVTRADRRDEIEFELPLARVPSGRPATVGDVADLLREHLPGTDPLAGYPDSIPPPLLGRSLRGFLAGSIDLVVRRTNDDGAPVFHVIDYKTNRLGRWGEPLTAWDYRPAALVDAMVHGQYPIQALLYAVALHRLLRWRLPAYDPAVHLGSVLYLFLRGMAGPATPQPDGFPNGVFRWQLPPALVEATSSLLHGRPGR